MNINSANYMMLRNGYKCITSNKLFPNDNDTVFGADCTGSDLQVFYYDEPTQTFRFGDKCLSIKNGQNKNGTQLVFDDCSKHYDKWLIEKDKIRSEPFNKCIDLPGDIQGIEPLTIYECHGGKQQEFITIPYSTNQLNSNPNPLQEFNLNNPKPNNTSWFQIIIVIILTIILFIIIIANIKFLLKKNGTRREFTQTS